MYGENLISHYLISEFFDVLDEQKLIAKFKNDNVPKEVLRNNNRKVPCYRAASSTTQEEPKSQEAISKSSSNPDDNVLNLSPKLNPALKRNYDEAFFVDEHGEVFPLEARKFEDMLEDKLIRNWFKGSLMEYEAGSRGSPEHQQTQRAPDCDGNPENNVRNDQSILKPSTEKQNKRHDVTEYDLLEF